VLFKTNCIICVLKNDDIVLKTREIVQFCKQIDRKRIFRRLFIIYVIVYIVVYNWNYLYICLLNYSELNCWFITQLYTKILIILLWIFWESWYFSEYCKHEKLNIDESSHKIKIIKLKIIIKLKTITINVDLNKIIHFLDKLANMSWTRNLWTRNF